MQIQGKGRVFKKTLNDNDIYVISDSTKNIKGEIENYYIPIRFKNDDIKPKDRDYIYFEGFTKPFKGKDGQTKISYFAMIWRLDEPKNVKKEFKYYVIKLKCGNEIKFTYAKALSANNALRQLTPNIPYDLSEREYEAWETRQFYPLEAYEVDNKKEALKQIDELNNGPFNDFNNILFVGEEYEKNN